MSRIASTRIRQTLTKDVTYVKLKYTNSLTELTTTNVFNGLSWNANNLADMDPVLTGANGAEGHSFYTSMFQKWCVLGTKFKITLFNAATNPRTVFIFPAVANSFPNITALDCNQINGQPYVKSKMLSPAGNGASKCVLSNYISTKKMYGISDITGNDDFSGIGSGVTAVGPQSTWNWWLFWDDPEALAVNLWFQVELTVYAKYYAKKFYTVDG